MDNIVLKTDSYKLNHWNQYPHGTEYVYSYFESRSGAKWDTTVFFGLQYLIKKNLLGAVVTREMIEEAAALSKVHFGGDGYFNRAGWEFILNRCGGKLPVRIKAIPEGTPVGVSNVLMTVENTAPECFWLTNALESLLTHAWYPSTVATLSRETKKIFKSFLEKTANDHSGLDFMLHDFGYRGASSDESAEIGGAAHLLNFMGTDTVPAIKLLADYYRAEKGFDGIAYSVAATEHSIMTSRGKEGEEQVVSDLIDAYPNGILSVVSDSYDIYNFVDTIVGKKFKERILKRGDGARFVVRPDSVTDDHKTPEAEMVWILNSLWSNFGGTTNAKGFKVLNSKIRTLWGDGIDKEGIEKILVAAAVAGFSAENLVFGMGGGLLQKVHRDIQRFAFKSSAQCCKGVWHDIYKSPKDASKASKKGKLKLGRRADGTFFTVPMSDASVECQLVKVFENGELLVDYTLEQIRKNAGLA